METDGWRTRLAGGGADASIKSRQTSPAGDERQNKSRSDRRSGRQPQRESARRRSRPSPRRRTSPTTQITTASLEAIVGLARFGDSHSGVRPRLCPLHGTGPPELKLLGGLGIRAVLSPPIACPIGTHVVRLRVCSRSNFGVAGRGGRSLRVAVGGLRGSSVAPERARGDRAKEPVARATKRQTGTAVCRNARQTDAKSGKTRTPQTLRKAKKFPGNKLDSDAGTARLKIVVSPVRVRGHQRNACKAVGLYEWQRESLIRINASVGLFDAVSADPTRSF